MELLSNELEDRSFLSQCTWGGCCIVVLACLGVHSYSALIAFVTEL